MVIGYRLIPSNDTKEDLKIRPNQHQRNGSLLKEDDRGVYMKEREKLILRIDHLLSLTSQYTKIFHSCEVCQEITEEVDDQTGQRRDVCRF